MFLLYDQLVEQRQSLVMAQAAHTTAIVSSLFPKNVRDRLLQPKKDLDGSSSLFMANKSRLRGFLDDGEDNNQANDAPIADLFPECTVYFAVRISIFFTIRCCSCVRILLVSPRHDCMILSLSTTVLRTLPDLQLGVRHGNRSRSLSCCRPSIKGLMAWPSVAKCSKWKPLAIPTWR